MRSRLTFERLSHHKERQILTKLNQFASFDENPGRYSPEFCWVLAERRILPLVNSAPKAGKIAASDALRYCENERLESAGRHRRRAFTCLTATFWRLLASAERVLGNSERARVCLRKAAMISNDCLACDAENKRYLGWYFQKTGDFGSARTYIDQAASLYAELGNDGHNLRWNGLASCLFASAYLHHLEGDYSSAVQEQKRVLQMLNPAESQSLYGYSLHNLSLYLVRLGDDSYLPEAESCLDSAAKLFYSRPLSLEMAYTNWVRGMIKARLGDPRARTLMEKAFLQLIELGEWQDVKLIVADLAHYYLIMRSPWEIDQVLRILKSNGGRGRWLDTVPPELLPIFARLATLAENQDLPLIWETVCELRGMGLETSAMPSLLPPIKFIA